MSSSFDPGPASTGGSASYDPTAADSERERELREQPLGAVLSQTAQDAADLFRGEVALAKAEVAEKGKQIGAGAGMLAGAAVAALAAVGALTALLIVLFDLFLPLWLACLIVLIIWGVVAAALASIGRSRIQKAAPAAPTETADSVKEDVQWVKTQTQSARK